MQPAFTTGELRPPIPATLASRSPIQLMQTPATGLLAVADSSVIAWIFPGQYHTQRHSKHFYDVAYVRPCSTISQIHATGHMLDTECFDTEGEALAFIQGLIQAEGAQS